MIKEVKKKDLYLIFDKFKNNNCIIQGDKKLTYGEVLSETKKALSYLRKKYKKKNLIFINKNNKDFLIFYLACLFGNYTILPVDPSMKKKNIFELKKKFKFDYIIKDFKNSKYQKFPEEININFKNNDYLVMMSSGTSSSEPKAILHSSENLINSAYDFSKLAGYNEKTKLYHCLPMFYMAGVMNTFLSCLFCGSTIVIGKIARFETLLNFWEYTKKFEINSLHLTPSIFMNLCNLYSLNKGLKDHLSSYQSIISTSSFLYPEIKKEFLKLFKRRIQSCYGITELGGPLTIESIEDTIIDEEDSISVGGHSKKIKIKIKNKNQIYIKSPYIMKGYLKNSSKLERPVLKNGFFNTGDLGFYKNNKLYYTGRNKEIIKVGGELVSLTLIENVSLKSSYLKECAALGVNDVYSGEKIYLFVVFKEKNFSNKELKLFSFLKKNLKTIEIPKKIIPIPNMPKTISGKIIKRKIKEMYLDL